MAFNGFGGLGASFPARYGSPQSQYVMSDSEFQQDWQSRLDAIPKTLSGDTQLVSSASGWDGQKATPFIDQINSSNRAYTQNLFAGADKSALDSALRYAESMGMVLDRNADGSMSIGRSAYGPASRGGGSHMVMGEAVANPAYLQAMQQMQMATQQRGENQVAQQQAYNSMLGQGQKNAVLGAGYATPGFGQVNGQAQNPFTPTPQEGVNMGWATGVYNPSGTMGQTFGNNRWGL